MTNPLGEWEPNWERIVNDPVWREEILPWLKDFEAEVLREVGGVPDMKVLRHLQGRLAVLSDLMQMPYAFIERAKQEKEREAEENARRRGFAFRRAGR